MRERVIAFRIQPEIGPPITPATGIPVMNSAMIAARRSDGYQ